MANNVGGYVLLGLLMAACGVGDSDDGPGPVMSDDPDELLGISCRAHVSLSGTMTPSNTPPRPIDPETMMPQQGGCWGVGTWTFTASVSDEPVDHPCATPPTFLPQYSFRVEKVELPDGEGLDDKYTYLGDTSMLSILKISSGGGGDCEGALELWSADNTMWWNLRPDQTGTTIAGQGDYAVFKTPQQRL